MFKNIFSKKSEIVTDEKCVDEVLERGVAEILPNKKDLKKLLMSGKQIKLYQGFDPTGTQLHIGHMVGLRKLRQFQDLGHHVVFVIGDGTGQAGDPSGKTKARDTFYSREELRVNARDYVAQAGKVVDFKGSNPVEVVFNGDWLNALGLKDVLDIASNFTLQQLSERDIFRRRMNSGEPVNMREFLYPLLQGYDSVALEVDLELGATDQTFNMLAGRTLVKRYLDKEKFVLTVPLLTDSSGKKIGKTEGNVIGITDEPHDLFGKIMSLGDDVIAVGFEYLTSIPMDEVKQIKERVKTENPKPLKERLAYEITRQLHGEKAAQDAQTHFTQAFSEGGIPENRPKLLVKEGEDLVDTLVQNKIASSKTKARRLIENGAVRNAETGEKYTDVHAKTPRDITLKVGKKHFSDT